MTRFYFDVWPADDINGTPLGELTSAYDRQFRVADQDMGSGQFTINRHDAQAAWCTQGNLVRVRLEEGGPFAYNDARYKHAFFIEEGEDTALSEDEEGGEELNRGGRSSVSIMRRAVLYPTSHYAGDERYAAKVPKTGQWEFTNRGPGEVLRILLRNADARSAAVLEGLTHDFSVNTDSAGTTWPDTDTDWKLRVGQTYLELLATLSSGGVFWRCGADLVLHAYENHPGLDLSASILLAKGTTLVSAADRKVHASTAISRVVVEGTRENNEFKYREVADSGIEASIGRVEGFAEYKATPTNSRLDRAGTAAIRKTRYQYQGPTTVQTIDEPGQEALVDYVAGDSVTVDIPGVFDEAIVRVAAIVFEEDDAGEADPVLELLASPFDPAAGEGAFDSAIGNEGGGKCGDCPEPGPFVPEPEPGTLDVFATLYGPNNVGRLSYPYVVWYGDGDAPPQGYASAPKVGPVEYVDKLVDGQWRRHGIRFLAAATVQVRYKASMVEVFRAGTWHTIFTLSLNGAVIWSQDTASAECPMLCGFTDDVDATIADVEVAAGDVLTGEAFWTYGAQSVKVPAGTAGGWLEVDGAAVATTIVNEPDQGQEVREEVIAAEGDTTYATNYGFVTGSLDVHAEGVRLEVREVSGSAGTWELAEELPAGTRLQVRYQALNGTALGTGNAWFVGPYNPVIPYPLLGDEGTGAGARVLYDDGVWREPGSTPGGGGSSGCCGEDDPQDVALANVEVFAFPAPELRQWVESEVGAGESGHSLVLADDVLEGSLLVLAVWARNGDPDILSGFTIEQQQLNGTTGGRTDAPSLLAHKVADGTEGDTFAIAAQGGVNRRFVLMEWVGIDEPSASLLDHLQPGEYTTAAGNISINPTGGDLTIALFAVHTDTSGRQTIVDDPPAVEVFTGWIGDTGTFGAHGSVGYDPDGGPITATAGNADHQNVIAMAANYPPLSAGVWVDGEAAADGDDATYEDATDSDTDDDFARVLLLEPVPVARARLRIAYSSAGSKTVEVWGANEADFSDEVLLDTATFTATGSYTPDDVEYLWLPASYQFFRLKQASEERRLHSLELRAAAAGEVIVTDPTNGDEVAELQDVLDNLAASSGPVAAEDVSVADAGAYYTGTDVEAVLQEIGAALEDGGGGGGAGGVLWRQVIDEDGSSFANLTAVNGTWDSDGSVIRCTSTDATPKRAYHNTKVATSRCIVEVEVRFPSGTSDNRAGSILLWDGANAGGGMEIQLTENADSYNAVRDATANFAVAPTPTVAQDAWYRLRGVVVGGAVDIYLDGVYQTSGIGNFADLERDRVGLRAYDGPVHFRNFKVWEEAISDDPPALAGVTWEQQADEDGSSFANFTAASGTWSSNGTEIIQTDTTATYRRARYNVAQALGYGQIVECDVYFPSSGQGAGANIQAALLLAFDGANGGGLAVVMDDGTSNVVEFAKDGVASLGTVAFTIARDTWYTLRCVHNNGIVTAFVDGALIGSAIVAAASTYDSPVQYIGLMTYGSSARFRNFKSWTLSGGTPGAALLDFDSYGPLAEYRPDRPPATPGTLDDEFDDETVSGAWSAWTGATDPATTDESTFPGKLYVVASASVSAPTYMQKAFAPASGVPFTFAMRLQFAGEAWENHSFQFGLAVMSASTTVIDEVRAIASDGSNGQAFLRLFDSISAATRSLNSLAFTGWLYLAIGRDASNGYSAWWSKDGYLWARLNTPAADATAVTHISLSIPANTSGGTRRVLVDWFRQLGTAPDPAMKFGR